MSVVVDAQANHRTAESGVDATAKVQRRRTELIGIAAHGYQALQNVRNHVQWVRTSWGRGVVSMRSGTNSGPQELSSAELVTTFGLRDTDAEQRVTRRLTGLFTMSSEVGRKGEIRVSVSHRVEELGHVVELVRRVEPSAVVRSCTAARHTYGSRNLLSH